MPASPDEFFLDPRAVRRAFERASAGYDAAAGATSEIRTRLIERLDVVRIEPQVVLDLGAGTAHSTRALKQRYRNAQVIAFDLSLRMLEQAARQQSMWRKFARVTGDAHVLPFKTASVDLALSNLMLEWCHDPDAVFREVRRVLKPRGLLTFTTLGPDTLREVRELWSSIDRHTHVHRFIDMHDLGDALLRARFSEPVMDTERLTVTYADLDALVNELRASGAANIAHGRLRGLTPPSRWRRFQDATKQRQRNDVLSVSLEVVYGHAWVTERPAAEPRHETRIPITSIGRPQK